jgi:hypothetical protein
MDEVRSFLDGILHSRRSADDGADGRQGGRGGEEEQAMGGRSVPPMHAGMKGLIGALAKARSLGGPQPTPDAKDAPPVGMLPSGGMEAQAVPLIRAVMEVGQSLVTESYTHTHLLWLRCLRR